MVIREEKNIDFISGQRENKNTIVTENIRKHFSSFFGNSGTIQTISAIME